MIQGHKPAAWTSTLNDSGQAVEGEQRQCCHCQALWTYQPGSGTTRGYCLSCDGWLCGRPACAQFQAYLLKRFGYLSGSSDRACMSYTDYVERLRDEFRYHPLYQLTPGGIVIPR